MRIVESCLCLVDSCASGARPFEFCRGGTKAARTDIGVSSRERRTRAASNVSRARKYTFSLSRLR